MNLWIACIVAVFTGIAASLGLGGGMILIIYLIAFAGLSQLEAQGINLLFFLPIAALALFFHTKNRLVEWRKIVPSILLGTVGAIIGSLLAQYLGSSVLSKIFGGFILLVGLRELFHKSTKTQDSA